MSSNPIREIAALGQSIWYDQVRRSLFTSGELARMIDEDDLRGVTSNPTIFEKAIGGSTDYNEALALLAEQGLGVNDIYESLAIDDIGRAADLLRPVYDRTNAIDGYISLEVSPTLAHDTNGTVADAVRLFSALNRPNVMIKVPATPAGIPAIEELISRGINVNVTLIFSMSCYLDVANAYIRGLERRAAAGDSVARIGSVASFFVSRIDSTIDNELGLRIRRTADDGEKAALEALVGKVAIANARVAHDAYRDLFQGERFATLRSAGALPQRQLWASTGTKNPEYPDVLYVDALIGAETVNTVPPATYTAARDHATPRITLTEGVDEARAVLANLEKAGIDLAEVTQALQDDAVASFATSFETLMDVVGKRRDDAIRLILDRQTIEAGSASAVIQSALTEVASSQLVPRIWRRDSGVWSDDETHQSIIRNSLGWMPVVEQMDDSAADLEGFASRIREDGFTHVVVLGMGGSSLCPEVLRRTFGKVDGFPVLHVLDSTVPAAVARIESELDLARTLFIVSSKSGGTTEPRVFHRYFLDRVRAIKGDKAGENFVAITDPGTALAKEASRDGFRRVFVNRADIGGRYSALSYFGLVPAALAGYDIGRILDRAMHAVQACGATVPVLANPGAKLGAVLGGLARAGRNKVTFVTPAPIDSLGLWIEQLLAESTGKSGTGIVPIAGEPLGSPEVYGDDRVFVSIAVDGTDDGSAARLDALAAAGHPVIRHQLSTPLGLGVEFFLWEFATAVAGAVLGINAFDQPNVQESKDNTVQLLETFASAGSLPATEQSATDGTLTVSGGAPADSVEAAIAAHLGSVVSGDYVAITQYFDESPERDAVLARIRTRIRDRRRVATTTGYGPRFLHSTGQLHKGGPATGVFIQLTSDDAADISIPGESYTFGVLKQAQALGDYQSLASRGRRAIRVNLGKDVDAGLARLMSCIDEATPDSKSSSA
ncbi:MAG: bifunctional transaldolase/phosoglucose isomerase [Acidobacteria bacterium]|nr:bifunctional transaldolase/phosoglucose isomerase [Acidobacteriota bacterium]